MAETTTMQFTLEQNLTIKSALPERGVVCSNPQRVHRLVSTMLEQPKLHTDSWGICVYAGVYQATQLFVAYVPMGGAGSGFAFLEMFAAGAQYIVRYGSNDRYVTEKNLNDILLIDQADNLYGLMRDAGMPEPTWGKAISGSAFLLKHFEDTAKRLGYQPITGICHHVEDYHAYNFPELTQDLKTGVQQRLASLQGEPCAWDMETAALYLRAQQFKKHGLTILQSLLKRSGEHRPYEAKAGEAALVVEKKFQHLIFEALSRLNLTA